MAKIYSGVQGIKRPAPDYSHYDFDKEQKADEEYIQKLVDYAKKQALCPEAGKQIRFGVCDGYACYIVLNLKPVELIHLEIGDAYNFQYANRLTAKDVREEIRRQEALEKLFSDQAERNKKKVAQ